MTEVFALVQKCSNVGEKLIGHAKMK